ncbi:hypothetical protein HDE_14161 [Halotydeus destructor]|nr:hypothetical protein HDE_14161 [Halotydeus destructor]
MLSAGHALVTTIFTVACIAGCAFHVSFIVTEYFRYGTTTSLGLDSPELAIVPALTVCLRYAEVMRRSTLEQAGFRSNLEPVRGTFSEYAEAVQKFVTMKQIFDFTPKKEEMLGHCHIRFPQSYEVKELNGSMCTLSYETRKFYFRDDICYQFDLKANGSYDYEAVSKAIIFSNMAFVLTFTDGINGSNMAHFVVHQTATYPTTSLKYAPYVNQLLGHQYHLGNYFVETRRLPAPYTTKCINYSNATGKRLNRSLNRFYCVANYTLKAFNKYPYTGLILDDEFYLNVKHIHYDDLMYNDDIRTQLPIVERKCNRKYNQPSCVKTASITRVMSVNQGKSNEITIRVNMPTEPNIYVQHWPKTSFPDFMLFLLSCLGTWLGMSVMSLTPTFLVRSVKQFIRYVGFRKSQRLQVLELVGRLSNLETRLKSLEKFRPGY